MGPGLSSKPSTTCFPGCAICLPTASITAPICAGPLPNLATGQSRSSRAPPGLLAFTSSRADGLSSEPSPGSIETADWQKTSRPQSPAPQPGSTLLPHSFSSGDWWSHSTTCAILIQTLSTLLPSCPAFLGTLQVAYASDRVRRRTSRTRRRSSNALSTLSAASVAIVGTAILIHESGSLLSSLLKRGSSDPGAVAPGAGEAASQ